jgi:AsmA protein
VKGNTLSDEEAATQKTDFSSLTATFAFSDGVAKTDDLSLMSPLLRVHGEGSANYIAQTTDFLVRTSIVGSLKGQGGQTIDDLKDVTIPLKVTGAWTDPQYKLVFDDVLKAKAKKEVEKAKEKLKDKLLNKLFN